MSDTTTQGTTLPRPGTATPHPRLSSISIVVGAIVGIYTPFLLPPKVIVQSAHTGVEFTAHSISLSMCVCVSLDSRF